MAKDRKRARKVIPKEVLGVAIPKELRRAGDKLIETAASPAGREMIAGALTLAATSMIAARAAKAGDGATGTQRSPDPEAIAATITTATDAVIGRLFGKPA